MARIRTIKPTFWEDEDIAALSLRGRLLFIATWNYADDEGLLRWTPDYIKASVFMYESLSLKQVEAVMVELEAAGHVYAYRGGRSQQRLAYIPKFLAHQRINRPQASKLPAPSLQSTAVAAMYAARDGWVCHICKGDIPQPETPAYWDSQQDDRLSLDHVHPRAKGGDDHPSNIRASHLRCNKSKGSRISSVNDSVTGSPPEGNREEGREAEASSPDPVAVERETADRIRRRRTKGEDIGPTLEALIREDVIRDLAAISREDSRGKCAHCAGRFALGSGWMHKSDCPQLADEERSA